MTTPEIRSLEVRLDAYERLLGEVHLNVGEVRQAQKDAAEAIRKEGALQREWVRAEADRVTKELLAQSASILVVSQAMVKLQQQVAKWAAGGSLAGAVILFIAVRALGF